jgi:hypothetical protein
LKKVLGHSLVPRAAASEEAEAVGIDLGRIERVQSELEHLKDDTPSFADLGVDRLLLVRSRRGGTATWEHASLPEPGSS